MNRRQAAIALLVLSLALAVPVRGAAAPNTPTTAKAPAADAAPLPDLGKALWIWSTPAALKGGAGVPAHVWFRRTFDLAQDPKTAAVLITADNGYDLFVNGQGIGSDLGHDAGYWKSVEKYDVSNILVKGPNVIAVHAQMLGGSAGLIAALRADFPEGPAVEIVSDASWQAAVKPPKDWQGAESPDGAWQAAVELGANGVGPWGLVRHGEVAKPPPRAAGAGPKAASPEDLFTQPPPDFRPPEAVVFVADDCSLYGNGRTLFRVGRSRAWTQMDIPGPSLIGRRLCVVRPGAPPVGEAAPAAAPEVLYDAGSGVLGSPSVSFDGRWVYFSLLAPAEKFYHIHRIPASGGQPERLTDGPFHDFDPAEMPDGRIVFSSTRLGTFEEYHSAPARGLFALDVQTRRIVPVTHTAVFDNEPRIMADGRIAFVRADNFGERAKVETQIHVVHPDGTAGVVEFGPDRPPIRYSRPNSGGDFGSLLRSFGYGSPAPLPDGRMACISAQGLLVATPGDPRPARLAGLGAEQVADLSPTPDGRLLCTTAWKDSIGLLDPATGRIVRLYRAEGGTLHSAAYLGSRPRPPVLASRAAEAGGRPYATGYLVCQSVFNSRHRDLDWARARAVRIYEGRALTNRSSHSDIVHIGTEAVEWGTVPLAPDGSFYAEVPADRAMALQLVDAEGRDVINELTWIYVRPGERRSCVGCHAPRQVAPAAGRTQPQALAWRPAKLLGQGRPHRFRANNADNGGALNLQLERFREVASIDLYELDAPAGPGREAEVRRLAEELAGPDTAAKIAAARRLAIFRDRAAAAALVPALRDRDREVRLNAALALAACGDRAAVDGLLAALGDGDPLVAQAAHVAIGNLTGRTEAFDPGAPPGARGEEGWKAALQKPDWAAIEQAPIAMLADADPTARHRAAVAIGHVGGPAGAAALREAIEKGAFGGDLRASLEAIRALGHLKDVAALDLLAGLLPKADTEETDKQGRARRKRWGDVRAYHRAAAAAEALGRIGAAIPAARPRIEQTLLAAYRRLGGYSTYCGAYGDHSALHACHASPMHHRIAEALDAMGSGAAGPIAGLLLLAMPTDPDRGLLVEVDAVERTTGRVLARSGRADEIIETCLAVLGDPDAKAAEDLRPAVATSPDAWAGNPAGEPRAAQVLAAVCLDGRYGPRLLAALKRYAEKPPAAIDGRLGNPGRIPTAHWVSFYLARTLGRLRFAGAMEFLAEAVGRGLPEAALGRPDAPGVPLLYIHKTMTPCWRAAAADALGRIGDRRAVPALVAAVKDLENSSDVRAAAAGALGRLAGPAEAETLAALAADCPEVSTKRALQAAALQAAALQAAE